MLTGFNLLSSYGIYTISILFLQLKFLSGIPIWVWIIIIFLLFIISGYLFYKFKEAVTKIEKLEAKNDKLESSYRETIYDLKRKLSDEKKHQILQTNAVKEDPEYRNHESEDKSYIQKNSSEAIQVEFEVGNEKIEKELFLPFPYEERKLFDGNRSENPNNDTFYQIKLSNSMLEGDLFVHASEYLIKNAFNSPEMYLKRACDYVNTLDSSIHTEILTSEPGKARLDGDDWIVDEKVKIKFI